MIGARFTTLAAVAVALAFWPTLVEADGPPRLREEVTVQTEIVRLGDLIDNPGRFATTPLFRAPDLGHTGQVPAAQIVAAARRAGLGEIDKAGLAEVTVTRDARFVPLADIEEKVATVLARGMGLADASRLAITFERGTRPIAVEPSAVGAALVVRHQHDPRTGRFEALVEVQGSALSRSRGGFRFAGQAVELVEFVVLARPLNRGEVIRAGDVTIERRPRQELGGLSADTVTSPTQAVGQAARRPLTPGRAFRTGDLMRPELVERNANVMILYEMPGFTLTLRGRAVETGSEGDVIQVQNLQTRRVIQATVSGLNRVTVAPRAGLTTVSSLPGDTPR